jgi:hypothetical protein
MVMAPAAVAMITLAVMMVGCGVHDDGYLFIYPLTKIMHGGKLRKPDSG